METKNFTNAKQLIKLNKKFLCVVQTTYSFRNDIKALKICKKLVDIEIKSIKKSKQPIDYNEINKILWRYLDLNNTIKFLLKTKSVAEINKGCTDINNMIAATEKQINELSGVNAFENLSATSHRIANAIGDTAQKIGDTVNEKIEGLKKMFSGEES